MNNFDTRLKYMQKNLINIFIKYIVANLFYGSECIYFFNLNQIILNGLFSTSKHYQKQKMTIIIGNTKVNYFDFKKANLTRTYIRLNCVIMRNCFIF